MSEPESPYPDLTPLLAPRSVAVIGASRSRGKVGGMVLSNLVAAGYKGAVYPVNPSVAARCAEQEGQEKRAGQDREGGLCGLRALATSAELPEGIDLAVVCLPQNKVLAEMRVLAGRGVRAAIVLAAGFRESGREGASAEAELTRLAREANMVLLGPNSLGCMNTRLGLNASFASGKPLPGGVAFFSQSGAMCVAVLDWAAGQGLGFSTFISLGNKAQVGETEVLRHLAGDPDTSVILGYCESVEDGAEFLAAARAVTAKKPLVMLKAGTTSAGARAVSAHTGAASGSPAAYKAAFRQAGVIAVDRVESLFGLAQAFATQPLPKGPGLAVLTNSGGPGILAADACVREGLTLPRPAAATLERLAAALPGFASLYNPVDLLGDADAERYRAALSALAADTQTHAVLVLLTPTASARVEATAQAVIDIATGPENAQGKPFAACFMGGVAVRKGREMLLAAGIPCYDFPEAAVEALGAMSLAASRKAGAEASDEGGFEVGTVLDPEGDALPLCQVDDDTPFERGGACQSPWDDEAVAIVEAAHASGLTEVGGVTALEASHAAGLPVLTTGLARSSAEAVRLAHEMGLPVTLTLATPESAPLDEIGELATGRFVPLEDDEAVRRAFLAITSRAARQRPEAYVTGCLVQAAPAVSLTGQGRAPFDLVVGFRRDGQFGPLLSFGMRGISSELMGDVAHRLAPLTPRDAREMLREVRFYPLLRGARGGVAVPLASLERLLLGVSRMALRLPRLVAAEFSPVLAGPAGVYVAGARLTLG